MTRESLSGRKLGNYDVGPLVGSGGMGEVYRGKDTALNRDVAIKVLLPAVAADQERLARFNREAQVLASLNHPNIAQIHGVEHSDAGPLLVLEYVAGPTLADRIAEGAIPIDDALAIARQIADALEAAHERGVIHRDLKPANIKVSEDGAVKVLDFGLAKAIDQGSGIGDQGSGERANSPTITTPAMTQAGLILGTAAYMSPEQAKGRVVDKRSDVWAFGCVLYEMLAGKRAFDGEDVTDTIAAVVRGEPNWSALPPDVPTQIRLLLKRCLEKDRRARTSDIGVARFLLNETVAGDTPAVAAPAVKSRRPLAFAAVGVLVGASIVAAAWVFAPQAGQTPAKAVRFTYTPPASQALVLQGNDHDIAIAPDGSFVVYRSGTSTVLQPRLMVRAISDTEARELPGTTNARHPFVSPDNKWVAFFVGGELRKIPLAGGAPITICRGGGAPRGASWGDDDSIVFATADSNGLLRVAASGGEPKLLVAPDSVKFEMIGNPHVLPGGKTVLFTSLVDQQSYIGAHVDAIDVATGARKTIVNGGTDPSYIDAGYLVFATVANAADAQVRLRADLRAVRFDPARLEIEGDAVPVSDPIMMGTTGAANYSVSRRGDLVFVPANVAGLTAPRQRTLVWVDRNGRETPLPAPARSYAVARISPDGSRIALDIRELGNDIWIWDINRQTLSPLNRSPSQDMSPVWMPDSTRILWSSTRSGGNPNLYWQAADGSGDPERLTTNNGNQFPTSTTPDGRTITLFGAGGALTDIFTVNLDETGRPQKPLISPASAFDFGAEISPDGKWIAYHSNESSEFQVYVRPFPNVNDGRVQISSNGGTRAAWGRSGRELFYLDRDGLLTAVSIQASGTSLAAGPPTNILKTTYLQGSTVLGLDLRAYDVAPDAKRFLMIKDSAASTGSEGLSSFTIVMNWVTELKARLPTP